MIALGWGLPVTLLVLSAAAGACDSGAAPLRVSVATQPAFPADGAFAEPGNGEDGAASWGADLPEIGVATAVPGFEDRVFPGPDATFGGWIAQGFTWNPASPQDRYNGPISFNDRANEYQLNQLYLFVDRPAAVDTGQVELGFRAGMVFGTDAFQFQAVGWDDKIVSDDFSTFYKLAFPELNVELQLPIGRGLSARVGKWYGLAGYEYGLAGTDFFYSYPLTFNITPFTHAGILFTYPLTDQLSTAHGLHRGMNIWDLDRKSWGYAGNLLWTSEDEDTSVCLALTFGPEGDDVDDPPGENGGFDPEGQDGHSHVVVLGAWWEHAWNDRLRSVSSLDFAWQESSSQDGPAFAEAYGCTQSLFYEWSDRVACGVRLEVLRDDDGYFIYGFRSQSPPAPGTYTNLTLGLNLRFSEHVALRPEVRWDWQHRDDSTASPAFDDARSSHQFLLATDLVLRF